MKKSCISILLAALCGIPAFAQAQHGHAGPPAKVTPLYAQAIPGMPNKSLKTVLVQYPPGGVNPAHTHAKSALIYATVLEGAVLNQLNGGPVRTFTKGQFFTEQPGDRHDVSANASQSEPATLLAVFVVDTDDTELTVPLKAKP